MIDVFFNPNFQFFLIGLGLFTPVILFKSLFIKVCVIIYAYPILILGGLWCGVPASRIIRNVGFLYYESYLTEGFIIALSGYSVYLIALLPIRKVTFTFSRFPLSRNGQLLCFLALLVAALIAYPKAMGIGDVRFGSLGSLVIIFLSILITSEKVYLSNSTVKLFIVIFTLFIVVRGERVDFILTLIAIVSLNEKNINVKLYKVIPIVAVLFFVGLYSGLSRSGVDISLIDLMSLAIFSIVNFGTAVDVVHVYMSSIWYYQEIGVDFYPILNLVSSYIPLTSWGGASHEYNFTWLVRRYIDNVGGGLFYLVGVTAFGGAGGAISGYLLAYVTKKLFTLRSKYSSFLFITFFIMQFRIQWYGATYFGNALFVSLSLLFILQYLNKKGAIKRRIRSGKYA